MANCSTRGHILIVRRQSYIPSYFSVYESQSPINNGHSECKLEAGDAELAGSRFYLLHSGNSTFENQLHSGYFTFPLRKTPEKIMESGTHTTRLLSSGLARRFSCNVSKMAYRMRNRMICDGYYGCPDEKVCTEKENGKTSRFLCYHVFIFFSFQLAYVVMAICRGGNELQNFCSVKMYYSFPIV